MTSLISRIISKSSSSGICLVREKKGTISPVIFSVHHKKKTNVGSFIVSYKSFLNRIYK